MSTADADLVERVLGGERAAFESLVQRHLDRATAVAHAVLGQDPAAEDVVQEAFLRAYRQLSHLSDPAAFAPWLMRIVRNQAISWYRRNRRRPISLEDAPQLAAEDTEAVDDAAEDRLAALRAALPHLRVSYREVLALKYEAGLSYEAMAETLGTSVANVEKRLYRARQALLALLESS